MEINRFSPACALAALLAGFLFSGCISESDRRDRLDLGVAPAAGPLADSAAYQGTIGASTYYDGMKAMRVRAYGVVVGLGKNGSSDCPRRIFNRLAQRMYKQQHAMASRIGVDRITPEAVLNDIDSAVVVVEGEIPPTAAKGSRFDVSVIALPGTQTKSLRGGRLYMTDLEIFRSVSDEAVITGQTLATAAGPVFVNPFSEGDAATQSNPRRGLVIGGGVAAKDRRIRLVLQQPSYRLAQQIQNRINEHFSEQQRTADAVSPSFVRVRVPDQYHGDAAHFLGLVRSLYLSREPQFEADRARALAAEMTDPNAPHALIALAFEGLGRTALPVLDRLYTHEDEVVRFHSAAAGLRLGDHVAADVMSAQAQDEASEFRFQAIRALGQVRHMASAGFPLRRLLHDKDARVQTAAYEALLAREDPMIDSVPIGGDNFMLDRVAIDPPNFVYVKRSGSRRIVLFGDTLRVVPPVVYRAPDGSLMLNAYEGDETLTAFRTVASSGAISPAVPLPLELPDLIARLGREAAIGLDDEVLGLSVDYAALVRALYHLCEDGSINAQFILEQPNAAELFGPAKPVGRPESES